MDNSAGNVIHRSAKDTLTPVELDHGDRLEFTLRNGEVRKLELVSSKAQVLQGNDSATSQYNFEAVIRIDGETLTLGRIVPAQSSFYEPLEIRGMRVWLDAVSDIFQRDGGFLLEKDENIGITCQPRKKARFAVNDLNDPICPEIIGPWYPEVSDYIDVTRCYRGENTWMGPFEGRLAHGGLDVNMPSGTPLYAPIRFDDHYLFHSLAAGDNNNRWRGIRKWPDGSVWWLQAHHLNEMLVPERGPLAQGVHYANTAGVYTGEHEHTHFVFRIFEEGMDYFLDPWIIFWQIFRNRSS